MSVAKPYARALFEAAQAKNATTDDLNLIQSQLVGLVELLKQNQDAEMLLMGPAVSSKDKVAVINEITKRLQFGPLLTNFLTLLAKKERLAILPEVCEVFGTVRLEAEGGIQGKVVSADPIVSADLDGIVQSFSKKLGKKVAFVATVDPNLLAGMKVTINGVTYDGTLRSQLQRLRDQLVQGTVTSL